MNKERKKPTTIKKLLLLLAVIVVIFTIINSFWFYSICLPYNRYINSMNGTLIEDSSNHYEKVVGEYRYTVVKPSYMDFYGRLTVSPKRQNIVRLDPETMQVIGSDGLYITLYIWPTLFDGYEYGVIFDDEAQGIFEQVIVDENIIYKTSEDISQEENISREKLISDNYDELFQMLQSAKSIWNM